MFTMKTTLLLFGFLSLPLHAQADQETVFDRMAREQKCLSCMPSGNRDPKEISLNAGPAFDNYLHLGAGGVASSTGGAGALGQLSFSSTWDHMTLEPRPAISHGQVDGNVGLGALGGFHFLTGSAKPTYGLAQAGFTFSPNANDHTAGSISPVVGDSKMLRVTPKYIDATAAILVPGMRVGTGNGHIDVMPSLGYLKADDAAYGRVGLTAQATHTIADVLALSARLRGDVTFAGASTAADGSKLSQDGSGIFASADVAAKMKLGERFFIGVDGSAMTNVAHLSPDQASDASSKGAASSKVVTPEFQGQVVAGVSAF